VQICLWHSCVLCLCLFQFSAFNTEFYFDKLYVYEGSEAKSSKKLGKFTGHRTPRNLLSRSNRILIRFVSDYIDQRKGFVIQWKAGKRL